VERSIFGCIVAASFLLPLDSAVQGQRTVREPSRPIARVGVEQRDSTAAELVSSYSDVARRVDSLQFLIVYNSELLKSNIEKRVIWIYAMLCIVIIASIIIYGTLTAARRQRRELEQRVFQEVAAAVGQLENQIRNLEARTKPGESPPKRPARRAKRSR